MRRGVTLAVRKGRAGEDPRANRQIARPTTHAGWESRREDESESSKVSGQSRAPGRRCPRGRGSEGDAVGVSASLDPIQWQPTTYEERDEAEVGADGNPQRRERVLDEAERKVDDGRAEGEDTDDPEVDGEVGETVETLDIADTLVLRSASVHGGRDSEEEADGP